MMEEVLRITRPDAERTHTPSSRLWDIMSVRSREVFIALTVDQYVSVPGMT
jgi:hypothetical protein